MKYCRRFRFIETHRNACLRQVFTAHYSLLAGVYICYLVVYTFPNVWQSCGIGVLLTSLLPEQQHHAFVCRAVVVGEYRPLVRVGLAVPRCEDIHVFCEQMAVCAPLVECRAQSVVVECLVVGEACCEIVYRQPRGADDIDGLTATLQRTELFGRLFCGRPLWKSFDY